MRASLLFVAPWLVLSCGGTTSDEAGSTTPGSGGSQVGGQGGASAAHGGSAASGAAGVGGDASAGAPGSGGNPAGAGGSIAGAGGGLDHDPVLCGGSASNTMACAHCGMLEACDPASLVRRFGSVDACRARFGVVLATWSFVAAHPGCAADLVLLSCDDFLRQARPPSCAPAPGYRAENAPCSADGDCASGHCAGQDEGMAAVPLSSCGTCGAPRVDEGASCDTDTCDLGLVCVGDPSGSYRCQRHAVAGESCAARPCVPTLFCTAAGVCAPFRDEGQSCIDEPGSCSTLLGLECDKLGPGPTNTCKKADLGQFCGPSSPSCPAVDYCVAHDLSVEGCAPRVADGASCAATSQDPTVTPPQCLPLASCGAAETCQIIQVDACN